MNITINTRYNIGEDVMLRNGVHCRIIGIKPVVMIGTNTSIVIQYEIIVDNTRSIHSEEELYKDTSIWKR